jgi:CBS domain-containing protein
MSSDWNASVREYASKALISVLPEAQLVDVQSLFERLDISAGPVDARKLVGIATGFDLVRYMTL